MFWSGLGLLLTSCAGNLGQSDVRLTNAEVTLLSFGSVHGELLECG